MGIRTLNGVRQGKGDSMNMEEGYADRQKSKIHIIADDLKNFDKLTINSKIKGNFSGIIKSIKDVELKNEESQQLLEIEVSGIFVEDVSASSETKDNSMGEAFEKAQEETSEEKEDK